MEASKLQWFVFTLLFMVSLSVSSQGSSPRKVSAEFKFLSPPPKFYAVPFGSNFKIDCTTNDPNATTTLHHRSSPSGQWRQLLPRPGKLVQSGHVYTLLDFGISNAGQYQCRASNDRGDTIKSPSSGSTVIPNPNLLPPVNIDPIYAVVLTSGQSYNITCSSVSSTTLQWLKKLSDGSEIAVPRNQLHLVNNADINKLKLTLMFKNAQKSDSGTYRCLMSFQGRTSYKYSVLQVYDPFKFVKQPKRIMTVGFGDNLKIDCTTNDPRARVYLYHQRMPPRPWKLLTPKNKKIIQNGQKFTIKDFGISNVGMYQCRGRNRRGESIRGKQGYGIVIPNPRLTPDVTISPNHAVLLIAGQSKNITCTSVAQTTLQWTKVLNNGQIIRFPSSYIVRKRVGDKFSVTLMIKNSLKTDSGNYRCLMTYRRRTNEKYISIKVVEFKFLSPPPKFHTVPFGSNFKFNCTTNDPNATTTLHHRSSFSGQWRQLLPVAGKLLQSGRVYTLLDFGISKTGQYQCRASNDRGDTIKSPSSGSTVIPNPNLLPPVNIDPIYAVVLTSGQSYNITCSSASSTTLQWFKKLSDGSEIAVPRNQLHLVNNPDINKLKLTLMFKNAQKSDSGTYKCLMSFQGRTSYKYSTLQVYDKGAFPRVKGRDKVLSVKETSRVVMSCAATGDPLPNIAWYKGSNLIGCSSNGKPCGPNLQYVLKNKVKVKNNTKFFRSQLMIDRVSRARDQGRYKCIASNVHGAARRSYQLSIN